MIEFLKKHTLFTCELEEHEAAEDAQTTVGIAVYAHDK